jgi:DNA-binding NtrC family response regulator
MYLNPMPPAESTQAFRSGDTEKMEVGVPGGAHFPLAQGDGTSSSTTRRNPMKPRLILLFTRDRTFDQSVREALLGAEAIVLLAQNVADALQIVCQRGREFDFALLDFDGGCRGMTLLSAVHTCYPQLPILVTTSKNAEHITAVAYANGARACLNKPLPSARLANAITDLQETHAQLAFA